MKLIVNPGLSAYPFHGDAKVPSAMCEVPDSSGRPRRYLVPQAICELLSVCDGNLERDRVVASMAANSNGRYTGEQIEQLITEFLIPRQLLLDTESAAKPVIAHRRLDRYLFFKVRFLKKEVVLPFATRLKCLFQPTVSKCLLALILSAHLWFYAGLTKFQAPPQVSSLHNASLLWLLLLLSFSGMLHEFGHAAALTRFGGRSAEIGFGIYICFFALFVDLSEAWRLTDRQRVIIDLSGMYFQGILLIFVAIAFALTNSPVWACCFVFTDIQIAANLNPLLRLDGYWALADSLGIPNLRRRSTSRILLPLMRGKGTSENPPMSPRTLRTLKLYFAFSLVFSAYFVYAIAMQCSSIVHNYPHVLRSALNGWAANSWIDALSLSVSALWQGMILLGIAVVFFRAVLWILHHVRWIASPRAAC